MAGMAGMARMAGMAERQKEWQNGRNWIQNDTYVLFMVHADTDDDDDDNVTLIFYNIDCQFLVILETWSNLEKVRN